MKDKLVKTGHKKIYYRFVSSLKGLAFGLSVLVALAIPVAIAYGLNAAETRAEEEKTSMVASSEESSDSSELTY